jgi:hypothetical protein
MEHLKQGIENLAIGDFLPLSMRVNELENLLIRLTDVNRQLLNLNLQVNGNAKLTKEAYRVSEINALTGMSKSAIRARVLNGNISTSAASSIGLILIPKSEVEKLLEIKNTKLDKFNSDQEILKAIKQGEVKGISIARKRNRK